MKIKSLKKTTYLIITLLFVLMLQNCERDDICAETTATTPRIIIEFYDVSEPEDLKSVPKLTVFGEGLITDPIVTSDATILFNENANAVELPLIIGAEGEVTTTRYVLEKDTDLRLDEDTVTNSNIDVIEISYTSEFVYVSRACGYKSIFNNLELTFETGMDLAWIDSIQVIETTIENENTVHVHIFH